MTHQCVSLLLKTPCSVQQRFSRLHLFLQHWFKFSERLHFCCCSTGDLERDCDQLTTAVGQLQDISHQLDQEVELAQQQITEADASNVCYGKVPGDPLASRGPPMIYSGPFDAASGPLDTQSLLLTVFMQPSSCVTGKATYATRCV